MTLSQEVKAFESSKDTTPLKDVSAKLDAFEREALGDVLRDEILEFRYEAKLKFLTKEISQSRYAWSIARANWLEQIGIKLGVLSADTNFKP